MGAMRWTLVLVGAAAVFGACVWSLLTHRRRTDELVDQLGNADPRVRARAGVALVGGGSRRAAKHLQAHLATEADPRARLAIALAVARHTAGASDGHLTQWAATELAVSSVTPTDARAAPADPSVARIDQPPAPEPVSPPVAVAHMVAPADRAIRWHSQPDA